MKAPSPPSSPVPSGLPPSAVFGTVTPGATRTRVPEVGVYSPCGSR